MGACPGGADPDKFTATSNQPTESDNDPVTRVATPALDPSGTSDSEDSDHDIPTTPPTFRNATAACPGKLMTAQPSCYFPASILVFGTRVQRVCHGDEGPSDLLPRWIQAHDQYTVFDFRMYCAWIVR